MKSICWVVLLTLVSATASAADWTNFRGPSFNGSTPDKNLPNDFSRTENVAWVADLPGIGASTPIISGDHVFVTSVHKEKESVVVLAFSRTTGKLLWEHEVAKGYKKDTRSTYASPSATTDGSTVVFFFGNGDMIAYTFAGQELWRKNLGPFAFGWTFSTSPVIYDGVMYMQILQGGKDKSVIVGMTPKTGAEVFRVVRPSQAQAESLESFNTPMPFEFNGRRELLVAGGDDLTGHDLKTGRELWRWGTWNPTRIGHWRLVPSPVAGNGIILVCAPKKDPIYAIKAGGTGQLDDSAIAWVSRDTRDLTSDVPSPAFYDGDFFVLSDLTRKLMRVDPQTGKVKWSVTTPGRKKYEASPLVGDDKVYIMNFDGEVAIVNAADGVIRKEIQMEGKDLTEDVRSSISAAHSQLFIRTTNKLYCIGKP